MSQSLSPFSHLLASDIMTQPVLAARDTWSVKILLDFLSTHRISGVPVTDEQGRLRGVVSLTDVLRFENLPDAEKQKLVAASCYEEYAGYELRPDDWHHLALHADVNTKVSRIMTPRVIAVAPDAPVAAVAQLMRAHRIHRVFVMQDNKALGVISTSNMLDVLIGAYAEAAAA